MQCENRAVAERQLAHRFRQRRLKIVLLQQLFRAGARVNQHLRILVDRHHAA